MDLNLLASVVSRMLEVEVTPGEVLSVSERAAVVRCHTPTGSVVAKYQTGGKEMASSERVALRMLARAGCLAVVQARVAGVSVVVMEDLGGSPSVRSVLEGFDEPSAVEALEGLAASVGEVHRVGLTVQERFGAARAGPPRAAVEASQLRHALQVLPVVLRPLGVGVPAGLGPMVEEAAERLERPGQALTLTHGDPGPDNALITPRGVVLVDFEKAGRRHALTDVAQWHVGPPLPEAVVHRMDARYREAVGSALGPLDDAGWAHALRPLVVHRVVLTLAGMLHTLCARDVPLQSGFGGRAVLLSVLARQRWRTDGLGELAQAVLDAVDVDWSVVPPRYPCFEESP